MVSFDSLALLCFAIAAVMALCFLYPYTLYPLLLRLLPRTPPTTTADLDDADELSVAMLFCAYNEESVLAGKLANIRELQKEMPRLQVFAYSDCSSDGTNQMLTDARDLLTPVIGEQRRGKVLGMRHLVEQTNADVLLFTDANVMIQPGALTKLVGYFSDPGIGSVGSTLIYEEGDDSAPERVGGLYWKLEEHIKDLESRTGSMMGCDGALFARRSAGYPDLPGELVDDMAASLAVLQDGLRCVSAKDVIVTERSVSDSGEEFRRKRRIACGSYSTYRYLRGDLKKLNWVNRFKFFSHKVMRWWGMAYLAIGALAAVLGLLALGFVGLPMALIVVAGLLLWMAARYRLPGLSEGYEVLMGVVATGIGVFESLTGKSYQTWNPATTR